VTTLVEFLRARLDEDEQAAKRVRQPYRLYVCDDGHVQEPMRVDDLYGERDGEYQQWSDGEDRLPNHRNTWWLMYDPARVLRQVESKRRIIDREQWHPYGGLECGGHPRPYMPHGDYGPGYCRRMDEENPTLRDLAMVYVGHPDYEPEWCPLCDGTGIVPGTEESEINATGEPCECLLHHPDYREQRRP
jgi:hypothetical protein